MLIVVKIRLGCHVGAEWATREVIANPQGTTGGVKPRQVDNRRMDQAQGNVAVTCRLTTGYLSGKQTTEALASNTRND